MNRTILIDADNLIDELEELSDSYAGNCSDFTRSTYNACRQQGVDAAIEVVRKQKSIDPVKHGKWIQISDYDSDDNANFMCSLCKYGDTHSKNAVVNYCWQCGAKMQPSKEGEI